MSEPRRVIRTKTAVFVVLNGVEIWSAPLGGQPPYTVRYIQHGHTVAVAVDNALRTLEQQAKN